MRGYHGSSGVLDPTVTSVLVYTESPYIQCATLSEAASLMKEFKVSAKVREKLLHKHGVTLEEVYECFVNREGPEFEDLRENHATDPATLWFIAETDKRRKLKVFYIEYDDHYAIKSAFEPTQAWCDTYDQLCKLHG